MPKSLDLKSAPESAVTLWSVESSLVQVTFWPTLTVTALGSKAMFGHLDRRRRRRSTDADVERGVELELLLSSLAAAARGRQGHDRAEQEQDSSHVGNDASSRRSFLGNVRQHRRVV